MTYLIETESSKYVLRKLLGEGATCKCYLGQKIFDNKENSDSFAIKVFKPNFFPYYSNEVNILSKLSTNDNIIKLHEYGQGLISPLSKQENKDNVKEQKEKIFYEVMEYAVNGELKDHVQGTPTRIPEKISAKIFLKIVLIVKYLHNNNITHCDIKPENVLLDKYYRPLLNDFGFSQLFEGNNGDFTLHKFAGSNIYCAPETRKAYTRGFDAIKNDIFSLGVLLFVITIGDFPFINTSFSDEKYKFIIKKNYERFWEFFNNIEISDEFKDLINNLIGLNPSQRFTIDQILEHPWIKKYNKEINTNDQKALENNDIDQDVINEFNSRKV
jgi:serine/threonine protein kinase